MAQKQDQTDKPQGNDGKDKPQGNDGKDKPQGNDGKAGAGKPKKKRSAPAKHEVPGSYYGFSVQVTRLLAYLLRCRDGESASVEHLDDVAHHTASGIIREQDKSGLSQNPISDRAVPLWKTLAMWVEAIRTGEAANTRFVIYVAQNYTGNLLARIDATDSYAAGRALAQELRRELWGDEPRFEQRSMLPDSLAPYVNAVLQAPNDLLARLITAIRFEHGSGSPGDDLEPLVREKAIGDAAVEPVTTHLLGWVKRRVDKLIEKKKPPIISFEEFRTELVAVARKFDRSDAYLPPSDRVVTKDEIDTELQDRVYIRQLRAIALPDSDLSDAVITYLRASSDRTSWSERGDVVETSFSEFSDELMKAWRSQRRLVELEHGAQGEAARGQLLYCRCVLLNVRLQGRDVPAHFVPGSLHALSDTLTLWWHPGYRDQFMTAGPPPVQSGEDT